MLEEMQIRNQQMMEQKEKSYQEHVKQLTEKMERERAQLLKEQERTLALKLQVFNCNTVRFLLFCFPATLPVHICGTAVRTWSPEERPCLLTCTFQSFLPAWTGPYNISLLKDFVAAMSYPVLFHYICRSVIAIICQALFFFNGLIRISYLVLYEARTVMSLLLWKLNRGSDKTK